ncbi:hypothetical protein ANCCAN_05699 [Ancylostoma caninum]|uniref:SCP domain-containing protein n=1 Tax=Ancylostoma caninum TaxID=29170 RepID=A0A368GVD2_ANCCA|nr:hypothetical protein ANCCAN_05699 [Ancylostoma caninum]
MFSAGLLFLFFNIATASPRECIDDTTYDKAKEVLDPLAKQMLDKMPSKPSYDCEMERAVLIKMTIDDEIMEQTYPGVQYKHFLEFETTKSGRTDKTEPSVLVQEALKQWSGDLEKRQASKFGCNIDRDENPNTTTFKIGCIFN